MTLTKILILAVVQGLAELLPVSSSAHVVVAEKLMRLDPASPPMTLLLVMLHTGTMFAVIVYFWHQWRSTYFQNTRTCRTFLGLVALATALTLAIGGAIVKGIETIAFRRFPGAEVEDLFSHLELIAPALAAAGILILVAGVFEKRRSTGTLSERNDLTVKQAGLIGAVQGLCLPFRGFSRSGATISVGMLAGAAKSRAETFSFALAVVLTPPVVAREMLRLFHSVHIKGSGDLVSAVFPSFLGAVFAFFAGLLALKWLSRWLEGGRWYLFGVYCIAAALAVTVLYRAGY